MQSTTLDSDTQKKPPKNPTQTELDFYSANSLKQQSAGIHVAPLGHIILIPSQPVFTLTP